MDHDVLSCPLDTAHWCGRIWKLYLDQRYVMKLLGSVGTFREFRLAIRGLASLLGHLGDYSKGGKTACGGTSETIARV